MYNEKIELHQIIKNLTKVNIITDQAEAIAKEIKRSTNALHSNKIIDIKLDRVMSHVDAKLYQIKAEILKWLIGMSMIQVLSSFAFNMFGI